MSERDISKVNDFGRLDLSAIRDDDATAADVAANAARILARRQQAVDFFAGSSYDVMSFYYARLLNDASGYILGSRANAAVISMSRVGFTSVQIADVLGLDPDQVKSFIAADVEGMMPSFAMPQPYQSATHATHALLEGLFSPMNAAYTIAYEFVIKPYSDGLGERFEPADDGFIANGRSGFNSERHVGLEASEMTTNFAPALGTMANIVPFVTHVLNDCLEIEQQFGPRVKQVLSSCLRLLTNEWVRLHHAHQYATAQVDAMAGLHDVLQAAPIEVRGYSLSVEDAFNVSSTHFLKTTVTNLRKEEMECGNALFNLIKYVLERDKIAASVTSMALVAFDEACSTIGISQGCSAGSDMRARLVEADLDLEAAISECVSVEAGL